MQPLKIKRKTPICGHGVISLLVLMFFDGCSQGPTPEWADLSADIYIAPELMAGLEAGSDLGTVLVAGYDAKEGHPAFHADPVGNPRALQVSYKMTDVQVPDGTKGLTLSFKNVRITADMDIALWAWVDRDNSAGLLPSDLSRHPPTYGDWGAERLVLLEALKAGEQTSVQLVIDEPILDLDFDGYGPYDQDGNGLPDDNCEGRVNIDQADKDHDGIVPS